jgi:hypothetical protein
MKRGLESVTEDATMGARDWSGAKEAQTKK